VSLFFNYDFVIEILVKIGQSQSFGINIHTFLSLNFFKQDMCYFSSIPCVMTILIFLYPFCIHPCYVEL
jgi:hypothetical protein